MQLVVCILGMHRSGTSCLAGCLEEAGVALGDVSRGNLSNRKGNLENPAIVALHEDLLEANDSGSWHAPPKIVYWTDALRRRRDALIASYERFPVWGFKDPRTLLTLDGWMEALPQVRCVGTFRHPWAVARSLYARNHLPHAEGLQLWTVYNRRMLDYRKVFDFDVISFDATAPEYRSNLVRVANRLGLAATPARFHFFDDNHRHVQATGDERLPPETAGVYRELCKVAG